MSRMPWLARLAVAAVVFGALCSLFRGFVLDDAYITFRYAENLALHGELTWNLGEDPVEGFTSMSWVLVHAPLIALGLDPVACSKVLSVGAGLGLLALLAWIGRRADAALSGVVLAALAASPAFALLTEQGMETTWGAALSAGAAHLAVRVVRGDGRRAIVGWYALTFCAALTRPDAVVLGAVTAAGVVALLVADGRRDRARAFVGWSLPFVAAGVAYMVARHAYFGHWLPNTFYLKSSAGLDGRAVRYVAAFLVLPALPTLTLAALLLAGTDATGRRQAWRPVLPLLTATGVFLLYLCTIHPVQGFQWRFVYPGWTPLLVALAHVIAAGVPTQGLLTLRGPRLALLAFAVVWPLALLPRAQAEAITRTQADRVAMGRALRGLDGTMFVSESGALPYYAQWTAVDAIGLNSEHIAHEGLSLPWLEALDPDLVMILSPGRYQPARWGVVGAYLGSGTFELASVTRKQGEQRHYYFVRRDSPLHDAVVARLRGADGVEQLDLDDALAEAPGVPVVPGLR
ncbi:MAG: hypothetical protein H6733_08745 [Alphaproteobacteria bacterium]|nr:hypothetical protein [Alphaproteobacteria bacterium]